MQRNLPSTTTVFPKTTGGGGVDCFKNTRKKERKKERNKVTPFCVNFKKIGDYQKGWKGNGVTLQDT